MSSANRHPREPEVTSREDEQCGFVIDVVEEQVVQLEDGREPSDVDIQMKPHPNGYQVTIWWTDDEGNRKQNDQVIWFEDPRDRVNDR